jgi:glycosyltransferase involved in cell wall biosynthesis
LAYLEQFKDRARAVVQRKRVRFVLSAEESDRLFQLILKGRKTSRFDWLTLGLSLLPKAIQSRPATGALYLNVGHTGLDEPSLPQWVWKNELRAVYLVHDLIPLTHPQFCRAGEGSKHAKRMESILSSASGVIANSQATLTDLQRFARQCGRRVPPNIVSLIAGDQVRRNQPPMRLDRPYFVVVGTIEARKNHMLLLEVWRKLVCELGDAAPKLVIIGQRGWEVEPVLAILDNLADLEGYIIEMNKCDDEEMAGLIVGARAVLLPSFVEGFGLPVVEALQLSTPVIASDLPVYRELAANVPTYLDPGDRGSWLKVIKDFLTDSSERRRQLTAMADFQPPTWRSHFCQIEQWLGQIK